MTSVHLGRFFHVGEFRAELCETLHGVVADLGMSHLPAAETDRDFHLVAVQQEPFCMAALGLKVMRVNVERKADFLELNDLLVLSRFLLPLGLFKTEFAVVHDLADRGIGSRGNFDQVHVHFKCLVERGAGCHDAQLGAVGIDYADLFVPNFFVDGKFLAANG